MQATTKLPCRFGHLRGILARVIPLYTRSLPPRALQATRLALLQHFEVDEKDGALVLSRKRLLPRRGITRLFIPRVVARLSLLPNETRYAIRLDGLALFIFVMIIGGVAMEVGTSRVDYPRSYPPAFIYALAGVFVASVIYDLVATNRALSKTLG